MNRRIVVAIVSLFAAVPLFAGLSAKYKEWPSTPQGYFMTSGERAQWAAITTDAEAEKFIQQFLAARGGEFPAEVAKRTQMADKYLTIGKTPGSKTLRGKTIILLGAPASMDVRDGVEGEGHGRARAMADVVSRSGGADNTTGRPGSGAMAGAGGISPTDALGSSMSTLDTQKMRRYYSFTYQNDLVKKLDKPSLVVSVVADPQNGKDELTNRADAADLDKAFELAAEMSIVKK